MKFWDKALNVDSRIIYVLMMIAIAIPLVKPIGLPMKIMPMTTQAFDFVAALPEGSKVLLSFDYSPGGKPELDPAAQALLNHFFQRGFKLYCMSSTADGAMVGAQNMAKHEAAGRVYDEDFVEWGYIAGGEAGITALAADVSKAVQRDSRGTPASQLNMMKDITQITDFAMVASINSGPGGFGTPEVWVRQVPVVYKVPFLLATNGTMTPSSLPYLQAGQLVGLLGGLRSFAEYELLLQEPSAGVSAMDAQSAAHSVIIGFILLGNIAYFQTRKKSGAKA